MDDQLQPGAAPLIEYEIRSDSIATSVRSAAGVAICIYAGLRLVKVAAGMWAFMYGMGRIRSMRNDAGIALELIAGAGATLLVYIGIRLARGMRMPHAWALAAALAVFSSDLIQVVWRTIETRRATGALGQSFTWTIYSCADQIGGLIVPGMFIWFCWHTRLLASPESRRSGG